MNELHFLADGAPHIDAHGRIRRSGVEAHRIAALVAGGMNVRDILADYPRLDAAQVEAAVVYARTHPIADKTYPSRTVKSASRDATSGGLAAAFAAAREPDEA